MSMNLNYGGYGSQDYGAGPVSIRHHSFNYGNNGFGGNEWSNGGSFNFGTSQGYNYGGGFGNFGSNFGFGGNSYGSGYSSGSSSSMNPMLLMLAFALMGGNNGQSNSSSLFSNLFSGLGNNSNTCSTTNTTSGIDQNGEFNPAALGKDIASFDPNKSTTTYSSADLEAAANATTDPTQQEVLDKLDYWVRTDNQPVTQADLNTLANSNNGTINVNTVANLPSILGWSTTGSTTSSIDQNGEFKPAALGKDIASFDPNKSTTTYSSADLEAAANATTDPTQQEVLDKLDYWVRTDNQPVTQADLNKLASSNNGTIDVNTVANLPSILGWSNTVSNSNNGPQINYSANDTPLSVTLNGQTGKLTDSNNNGDYYGTLSNGDKIAYFPLQPGYNGDPTFIDYTAGEKWTSTADNPGGSSNSWVESPLINNG